MNKHNNYVVLTTALVIIISIFVSAYFVVTIIGVSNKKDVANQDKTISLPCSEGEATNILNDASVALDPAFPENTKNLGPIADTIMSYEKYPEDTNCLNILTTRYVYTSDYKMAKQYLDLLVQKQGLEVNTKLPQNFLSIEELKNNVEFLGRKIKEIEQNNPYGSAI